MSPAPRPSQWPRWPTSSGCATSTCREKYTIEVVDLLTNPKLAEGDQIVAIPTLVRKLPAPMRRIIGDLSNTERALVGLDLKPRNTPAPGG